VEDRSLADPRGPRDLVDRHRGDAALREEPARGRQDPLAVARGVRALAARGSDYRELGQV
jgi:hypothetical protein